MNSWERYWQTHPRTAWGFTWQGRAKDIVEISSLNFTWALQERKPEAVASTGLGFQWDWKAGGVQRVFCLRDDHSNYTVTTRIIIIFKKELIITVHLLWVATLFKVLWPWLPFSIFTITIVGIVIMPFYRGWDWGSKKGNWSHKTKWGEAEIQIYISALLKTQWAQNMTLWLGLLVGIMSPVCAKSPSKL